MKPRIKPTVALIFGGRGCEHDVSVEGAKFMLPLIDTERYNPLPILITRCGEWLTLQDVEAKALPAALIRRVIPSTVTPDTTSRGLIDESGRLIPIDAIIPLLHGDHGEDGEIAGVLESSGIPYVGCDVVSGAIAIDKVCTKILAEHLGIPTARYKLLVTDDRDPGEDYLSECESALGYPMFVKPARLGSSFGASKANDRPELIAAIRTALATGDGRILIERCVNISRELECAYLSTPERRDVLSIGEIKLRGSYDFNKKYLDTSTVTLNPRPTLSDTARDKILSYSRRLATLIGVRDLSRFDFFEDTDGEILFNELNTFPGFTASSMYPMLMEVEGITNKALVSLLISSALSRAK